MTAAQDHGQLRLRAATAGISMLEVVVAVVVAALLAAQALPRLVGLEADARIATVHAIGASMRVSVALARSAALVKGSDCSGSNQVQMEGATVQLVHCAPTADAQGIVRAAGLADERQILAGRHRLDIASNAGSITVALRGSSASSPCHAVYTQATASTGPSVQLATGGC